MLRSNNLIGFGRGSAAVATFTPADLFVTYSDGFWLDANVGTCTDFVGTGSAGTTPTTTDAATILSWNDQSGNGRHFSRATGPTRKNAIVNGHPVLRFDGTTTNQSFVGSTLAGFGSAAEIFIVFIQNVDTPDAAQSGFCFFGSHASEEHHPYNDGNIYLGWFATDRKTVGNPTPLLTSWRLVNVYSASADWNYLLDGTSIFSTSTNTVGFSAAPTIGASNASTSYRFDGDIAEVICVNAKLATQERTDLKAWFASKYALTIA